MAPYNSLFILKSAFGAGVRPVNGLFSFVVFFFSFNLHNFIVQNWPLYPSELSLNHYPAALLMRVCKSVAQNEMVVDGAEGASLRGASGHPSGAQTEC